MIDIHTHILPGLDDGSATMAQSLEMAAMAAESGTDILAATPHTNQKGRFENYACAAIDQRLMQLKKKIYERGIRIHVFPGMEIMASDDLGRLMDAGMVHGINFGPYYLVEFPFDASRMGAIKRWFPNSFAISSSLPNSLPLRNPSFRTARNCS